MKFIYFKYKFHTENGVALKLIYLLCTGNHSNKVALMIYKIFALLIYRAFDIAPYCNVYFARLLLISRIST